jgi:hypothetical protein
MLAAVFAWAWSLLLTDAAAAACSGPTNCLTMTILPSPTPPSQKLDVSLDLVGITEPNPQPLTWSSYESWTILHLGDGTIGSSNGLNPPDTLIIPHVVWIAPGGDPNDLQNDSFDFFTLVASGNLQTTDVDLSEGVSYFDLFNPNGSLYGTYRTCYFYTGFSGCPILSMGQSYTIPIEYALNGEPGQFSTFTVTLNAAVPEPATWAVMAVGFATMGAALRIARRRRAPPAPA